MDRDKRDARIEALHNSGLSLREIAKMHGLTAEGVRYILRKRNVDTTTSDRSRLRHEARAALARELAEGAPLGETLEGASKRLHVKKSKICKLKSEFNIHIDKYRRGNTRLCTLCGQVDDINNFYIKENNGYTVYRHKPCQLARMKAWEQRVIANGYDGDEEWMTYSHLIAKFSSKTHGPLSYLASKGIIRTMEGENGRKLYNANDYKLYLENRSR